MNYKHKNCLDCITTDKDASLLERVSIKDDKTINFKVKKHKIVKDWENRAENGEIMRII